MNRITNIASMKKARIGHSGVFITHSRVTTIANKKVSIRQKYLYVIGGYDDSKLRVHQSIERLNVSQPDTEWEFISIQNKSKDILLSNSLAISSQKPSSPTQIILLGGKMAMEGADSDSALSLDIIEDVDSNSVKAVLNDSNYTIEDDSFNNRIACPGAFTEIEGDKYVIGV